MSKHFKLYTDASRRQDLENNPLCIIAGVLLDPDNKPVMEFSLIVNNSESSDELEMCAFKEGISLAKKIINKDLVCYMDSLNSVNKINRNMDYFVSNDTDYNIKVMHISRKLNTYANALAKLPFNIDYFGSVLKAYHNLNRSKKRFYTFLKK